MGSFVCERKLDEDCVNIGLLKNFFIVITKYSKVRSMCFFMARKDTGWLAPYGWYWHYPTLELLFVILRIDISVYFGHKPNLMWILFYDWLLDIGSHLWTI